MTKAYDVITAHNQLKALARMVNSGKDSMTGRNFMLSASIDLSGIDWTPIGTAENPFKGTFTIMGNYSISNLPNDLFGVVEGGTVKSVTISGGTGRLVNTLKSGTVENCMSTAKVTGEGGGLVGTSAGTVKNSYYYNEGSKNTVAVSGNGTVASCYYLADVSTWGQTYDPGARTEEEFKAGRVTWELGSSWGANASDNLPCLGSDKKLYQLTLTKLGDAGMDGVTIENDNALTNGDTQYLYGAEGMEVQLKESVSGDQTITYSPAKPEAIQKTGNEYFYTVGKAITPDTSWYDDSKNEFTLSDAADLFGLAQLVNGGTNFANKTVKLGEDIDLIGYIWTPIGIGNYSFKGVFDGGNHKITSMNVHAAGTSYAGLFGYVLGGTVKNLRVEGSVKYTGGTFGYVGGIVGCCDSSGKVTNCLSKVMIAAQGNYYVGGVVGNLITGTINLCWNEGTVTGGSGSTGGIVGTNSNGAVTNCANFGEVKGSSTAGGISGSGAVANSYNLGNVTGAENTTYGISSQPATNSYYLCKLNGTDKKAYVNATEIPVTLGTDGKTYMVGEKKLVDLLNDNHGTNELWFTNPEKNVYLPHHATKWDGETDTDCTFKTITVTYDPNGGVNKDGSNTPVTVNEMVYVVGEDVVTPAKHIVLAADAENLGFKHENGTFSVWTDDAGVSYTAGNVIDGLTTGITLTAQWDKIWMGEGSANDPYQVSDAEKLTALQTQVNDKGFTYDGKWFKLTDSISLTGNWTPIGTPMAFAGSLDGNGKTIDGLNVNVASGNAGLFASASGGTFKNLKLSGTVNGAFYAGGLIGGGSGVTLDNIEVNVTVSGGIHTGGLVGRLLGTLPATTERTPDISNCTVHGSVIGRGYVGGVATSSGDNSPKIENCHNYASVTSTGANNASAAGSAASPAAVPL